MRIISYFPYNYFFFGFKMISPIYSQKKKIMAENRKLTFFRIVRKKEKENIVQEVKKSVHKTISNNILKFKFLF